MEINKLYQGDIRIHGEDFDYSNFRRFLHFPSDIEFPENISSFLNSFLFPDLGNSPVIHQYCIVPIHSRNFKSEQVILEGNRQFNGPMIYSLLKNCDLVVAHLISYEVHHFRDNWQSFISQCFNNTLVQMSSARLRKEILTELKLPEARLTQRYAPGYCGWPVHDRKTILNILEPPPVDVSYADGDSFIPQNCSTGIYGIRKDSTITEKMPCYTCTSISCGVHFDFIREIT